MANEKPARKAHKDVAVATPPAVLADRPAPHLPPASPAVPQGPSNTATNTTGPVSMPAVPARPFNPMGQVHIATGPNPDGLRHQGLVAAQGQPGMEHLTTESIQASRAPAPKEK